MSDMLIQHIAACLTQNLPHQARHAKIQVYPRKNSLRLYYPELDSSHYELCLEPTRKDSASRLLPANGSLKQAGEFIEIAFNFTGSRAKNDSRLALFEKHLSGLRQPLGGQLIVEPWQTNWMRAVILLPKDPLAAVQAEQHAQAMLNFLDLTYPILRTVFETVPAHSKKPTASSPTLNPHHYGAYAILSRQIDHIQAFLQGRASRPPDDLLCDWVQFCYTFELHREGADLFNLIDQNSVQPWLYERAQRLAKVCRIRANRR